MKRTSLLVFWQFCLLSPLMAFLPQTPAPAPTEPQSITLPIGTEIAISTIDRIDSKTADLNREYAASLDDPVIVDGVTVVPARSNAFLRVTDVKNPKFKRASLAISLVAVIVNGQRVEVNTDKVDSQSGSKAKRTAIGAAAGAGAGAAIGAAVGGGAGAGIGAAIGGLSGAGAGILTGKGVQVAPETRFTYKLTEPVVINYEQTAAPQAGPQTAAASVRQTPAEAALPPIASPPPPPDEPQAPPKTPINSGPEPEFIGAVYFQNESGALIPIERSKGTRRTGGTGGTGLSVYWEMDGARSPVRLTSGLKMLFVVRLANGIDPGGFTLLPLEARKDSRRTKSDPRNKTASLTLLLNVTKVGESTYGLTPVSDLAAGEYAFSPKDSDDVYCFGVDPAGARRGEDTIYAGPAAAGFKQ
jgi:hypothetical protein